MISQLQQGLPLSQWCTVILLLIVLMGQHAVGLHLGSGSAVHMLWVSAAVMVFIAALMVYTAIQHQPIV